MRRSPNHYLLLVWVHPSLNGLFQAFIEIFCFIRVLFNNSWCYLVQIALLRNVSSLPSVSNWLFSLICHWLLNGYKILAGLSLLRTTVFYREELIMISDQFSQRYIMIIIWIYLAGPCRVHWHNIIKVRSIHAAPSLFVICLKIFSQPPREPQGFSSTINLEHSRLIFLRFLPTLPSYFCIDRTAFHWPTEQELDIFGCIWDPPKTFWIYPSMTAMLTFVT